MRVRVVTADEGAGLAPDLVALLGELSDRASALDPAVVAERSGDDRVRVLVATSGGQLLGTATLTTFTTLTDGLVGHVEDVVVSGAAQGAGVGRLLMNALHDEARGMKLAYVELTTRPSREAANALYQSLGYERRSTNVYRLPLGGGDAGDAQSPQ